MTGSILSKNKILEKIDQGDIIIEPYSINNICPAGYDLTLSNEFRYYKRQVKEVIINEDTDYTNYTEKIIVEDGHYLTLLPKETVLGITTEKITLSNNLCGLLNGRSRFARMGLFIHITAFFMNPGISNRQVLEIHNSSPYVLKLKPGTKICQFIFLNMDGKAVYKGKFANQIL